MIGVYRALVDMHRNEGLSFSQVNQLQSRRILRTARRPSFQFRLLYVATISFRIWICLPENARLPSQDENASADYEEAIAKKGIDLQILGIGRNGHIGFNEPGTELTSRTRVVALDADDPRGQPARFPGW